jgi:acetyl esterase/lipase
VQDANYGVRWLTTKTRDWKGDATNLRVLCSSSGGHMAELVAMHSRDPRDSDARSA